MKEIVTPKTLPGFMELSPNDQIKFNQMLDTIKNSYEEFGFLPLDTPIIEYSEVLLAKAGGETEKQIYRFTKGETDLSLRFDLTVPLSKYVAEYYNDLSFPFKRYQIGKVYRGEKAQKGRYREFYQCDIDIIGDGELSIINDAQIPNIIYNTFKKLGFDNFTVHINNRKILNGLFENLGLVNESAEILRIIDKIDKIGEEKVRDELGNIISEKLCINSIIDFIKINGSSDEKINKLKNLNIENEMFKQGLNELESVIKYLKILNVPEEYYCTDLKIARGLDYYTGTVYETFLNEYRSLGSICSGGRYENLAEYYIDKKLPGVGISIGLTRLFYQLREIDLIKVEKNFISDVLVIPLSESEIDSALELACKIRNSEINTDVYLENDKVKKKMKYADKWNIPFVIIVGEEEVKSEKYTLKNMHTGEQETLDIENIILKLKK